ncbi:putative acyl-CoA synthetase YngI [Paramyrothecium foliicola]|nr:putative acyl-CoA synthetase YngI [Paramyrothecium foliicola]
MDTQHETSTDVAYTEGPSVSMTDLGVVFEGPSTQTLQNVNIAQLIRLQQSKTPEKEAVVSTFQDQRLTYSALHSSSFGIARRLYSNGVRPGHHVLVVAGNIIEYVQLLVAVGGLGAVFCIANPTFTAEEILAAIDFLEPTAIFVANRIGYRNNTSLLSRIVEEKPGSPLVVQIGDTSTQAGGILNWREFLSQDVQPSEDEFSQRHWAQVCPEATLCIQFTSGTTGPRKAAMASNQNLINNASSIASRLGLKDEDRLLAAFSIGAKAVLPSDVFVASDTLKAASDERCTAILAVPTMLQALLDHPDATQYAKGMRLRTGINAGQTMSKDLALRLAEKFGLNRLGFAYGKLVTSITVASLTGFCLGMTEASCIVFMTEPEKVSLADDNTSVGYAMPHTFVAAVDDHLQVLPPGSQGELLVSGYAVFQGYYKNPGKTAETLVKDNDGRTWLRTGDLVMFDPSGRCMITGRVKDMIKKGGENIFPADIEKALEQHPDIESVAVVGIQDHNWGENVGAFIKRRPEARGHKSLGKRELRLWLRNRLAALKMPEHVFLIGEGSGVPEEFPTNHTGKLLKAELRGIAERLVAVPSA